VARGQRARGRVHADNRRVGADEDFGPWLNGENVDDGTDIQPEGSDTSCSERASSKASPFAGRACNTDPAVRGDAA
jgi:hypothetical protein